jgi:hypothetical protein
MIIQKTSRSWVIAAVIGLLSILPAASVAQSEAVAEPSPAAVESAAPTVEVAGLQPPPDTEGVGWTDVSVLDGAEIEATSNEGTLAQWEALLAGTGATYEEAGQLNAQAVDPQSGEPIGMYSAIRIAGADEGMLREAMLGVFREGLDPEEYTFEESEVGGKAVTVIARAADEQAAVYVHGDTAHLVDLPDAQLATVLAALP